MEQLNNRYEFIMIFDVENGNPNGDPDSGNMPRIDAETGYGIVTDVCLKRKVRNYINDVYEGEPGKNILVKTDKALNIKFTEAYQACGLKINEKGKNNISVEKAKDYICLNYYDVRAFGAVMNTGNDPCGIVRGPVQINFARSIDPVLPQEITITRQAVTRKEDMLGNDDKMGKKTEMGKKTFIPYGLYRAEGYVSAFLARKTQFSEEDLDLLWESIMNMFEFDHSAARGKLCLRKLYVFKHETMLGNAPSHVLFDRIVVTKNEDVEIPRKFTDYNITIGDMPEGVELIEKL